LPDTAPGSDTAPGVLITRPEPGAGETAARVAALGFSPIIAPVVTIRALPARLPPADNLQAILVASGNALGGIPPSHRRLPMFAVGAATAARAHAAGFAIVSSADGDADALIRLVTRACDAAGAPLLLLAGRDQGVALAGALRAHGFHVIRRVTYTAAPVPHLPATARDALRAGTLAAALFFSADTARHFVRLLGRARLHEAVRTVDALAIGGPAAVALQALPWRRIRVAARPNQDAMLALLDD